MKGKVVLVGLLSLCGLGPVAQAPASAAVAGPAAKAVVSMPSSWLEREVRHELVMLPYYSVFDHLDAERVARRIEGVERVVNKIHVLPVSPFDDQIRIAAYRAIYGTPALNLYAHQAIPPIHIIVENGRITLEGVVANENDRNLAYMKALEVPGAFSVTNHLMVEN